MNRISRIINPYTLLILGVFIEYFPAFFGGDKPSISIGPVDLYITDISFIFLCMYALFGILGGQSGFSSRGKHEGRGIQIIFGLLFSLGCIKWVLQSNHDILSIRTLLDYVIAYPFLFLFPMLVKRKEALRKLHYLLIIFLVYIFILHIYAFATQGLKMHILSGGFLTMLSALYFLAASGPHVLTLSPKVSFCVKALVITTFVMVGHRSGFVGILLGLFALSFFNKMRAIKEAIALIVVLVLGAGMASVLSPDLLSKLTERASTTFDTDQTTYQGRYHHIFLITRISLQEHPVIGNPLTGESRLKKNVKRSGRNISISGSELVVTPHNLVLEWLYYYGSIGLLFGLALIIAGFRFNKRFLIKNKNDVQNYQLGVAILCTMVHNLFFALTNVTATSPFATFFLYFPLIILISVNRNMKIFYK